MALPLEPEAAPTSPLSLSLSSVSDDPGPPGSFGIYLLSSPRMNDAESIRREFARAWGEIGAAWGVSPSSAATQGYFLAHGGPLSEREIRAALGLSHRAAALALAQCEEWGLIERLRESRRTGRRGPAAAAYAVVGDNWEWFRRVTRVRKEREMDPVIPVIARCASLATEGASAGGDEAEELRVLGERLQGLLRFVQLFDRGVGVFVTASADTTRRIFGILGELDEVTVQRLIDLFDAADPDDLVVAARAVSRLSPRAARRLAGLAASPALTALLGR
jgi:DNA-binding transcriptional regulator GbsR (MarR family)